MVEIHPNHRREWDEKIRARAAIEEEFLGRLAVDIIDVCRDEEKTTITRELNELLHCARKELGLDYETGAALVWQSVYQSAWDAVMSAYKKA